MNPGNSLFKKSKISKTSVWDLYQLAVISASTFPNLAYLASEVWLLPALLMRPFLLKGETPRIVSISHMCTSLVIQSTATHFCELTHTHHALNLDRSEFALSGYLASAMVPVYVCTHTR